VKDKSLKLEFEGGFGFGESSKQDFKNKKKI